MRTKRFLSGLSALVLALVLLIQAPSLAASSLKYPFETVTTDTVNMRKTASAIALILERLNSADKVTVFGESGNYFQVSYNNRQGYILKEYLSTSSEDMVVATPTP